MIITQTPLRISLFGGGTDFPDFYRYHPGCVLTTAIDKYIYCIVTKRFDSKIYINYSQKEKVDSVDQIQHDLVREAMKITGVGSGVEISFLADIPSEGSGLGSSASVTVGVLNALYLYLGKSISALQLAQEACKIEIEILKKPIGIQDQYIAAFGGTRLISFDKNGVSVGDNIYPPQYLQDLFGYLMVYHTGVTRSSSSVLNLQSRNISKNKIYLKKLADQVKLADRLLIKGKIEEMGKMMHRSWAIKKKLASSVSNHLIDSMYQRALAAGALGGKISGAGGGGFLTLFVPSQNRQKVRNSLSAYEQLPVNLSIDGSKAIFNIRQS